MSEETAIYFQLYYGNRGIDKSSWFQHALIYWDKLVVIRPTRLLGGGLNLNREEELEQAGLLRILDPVDALKGDRADLDQVFLQLVDSLEPYDVYLNHARDSSDIGRHLFRLATNWRLVQFDRAAGDLFWELEARRLARPGYCGPDSMNRWARKPRRSRTRRMSSSADTWTMDVRVIYLYGVYLAASMLRQESSFEPVTDSNEDLTALARPVASATDALQTFSRAAIMDALPVPTYPISIGELIEFKRKHVTQLRELRTYLSGKLAELALVNDEFVRATRAEIIKHELRKDVTQLSRQMSRRNWPRIAFGGIAGIVASVFATGSAATSGSAALPLGLGIAAGVTSIPPAVIAAGEIFRTARSIKGSPLAYAALTERL